MKLITPFDPSTATSGTLDTLGVNPNEQLMLYNDSIYGLKLTFEDGSIGVIPPSWNKDFILVNTHMGKVKWDVYVTLNATNYPMSQVYGELYEPGEHVASVNAGMQRGMTVTGGAVVSGQTTQIVNTGNPPGNNLITGQPSDAASATVLLDTSGNLTIKSDNAGVLAFLVHLIAGATPSVNLGDNNVPTFFDGGVLQTDGTGRIIMPNAKSIRWKNASGTAVPIIYVDAGNITHLATTGAGNSVQVLDGDTNLLAQFNNNGIDFYNLTVGKPLQFHDTTNGIVAVLCGADTITAHADGSSFGKIYLNSGRLHGIQGGSIAAGSGTVINHGLGVTPASVLITPSIAQPGSGTIGVGSVGSTSFTATIGAGSTVYWEAKNYV